MMGAMPAASELAMFIDARYAVAPPRGASLSPIFAAASVTPEVERPIRTWRTTRRGKVRRCLPGMVVNVHPSMEIMKRGPATRRTDLLLYRSAILPHMWYERTLTLWLKTASRMTMKRS